MLDGDTTSTPSDTEAPTTEAPAPVDTAAPVAPVTPEPAAPEGEEELEDAWFTQNAEETDGGKPGGAKGGKGDQAPVQETPAEEPEPETPADAPLSEADKNAVKRFQLDPDEVAGLKALPPASRAKFIASLQRRAEHTDRVGQELAALKRGQPPQQQGNPQQQQPAQDDLWAGVKEWLGDGAVEPLRKVFDHHVQSAIGPYQYANNLLANRIMADDVEYAFDKLQLPEGVDKQNEEVRDKILAEAFNLLDNKFDIRSNNYRHAIPLAASSIYSKQIAAAERTRKANAARQALRGSPDPGGRAPTTRAPLTEDERESRYFEGDKQGLAGAALHSFVNAGT